MSTLVALSVGCARTWVGVYTLCLAAAVKEARRREIDSDVWEQQWLASRRGESVHGTAGEILTRTLFGIFDDIMWRLETGRSARSERSIRMNEPLYMRALVAVGVVVALLLIVAGIGAGADALLDPDTADGEAAVAVVFAIAGAAVLFGLLASRRNPVLGIGLVAAGAITVAVIFYWLLVITIPVGIAMVAIAFFRARQTGWPGRAGAA